MNQQPISREPASPDRTSLLSRWWAIGAVLALFAGMGFWYSLTVPPFETPDEIHHYAFARHLSQGGGLPVQTVQANEAWAHEGTQPPLYYFLVGRLTAAIDQSDFDSLNRPNPHANMGDPLYPGNKNRMLYSAQRLPWRGAYLALLVGRWVSLTLGILTVYLIYLTARLVWPADRALPLLASFLAASIPQFAFISAAVSNDSMIIVTSTAAIYWLARLTTRAGERPIAPWEWAGAGLLAGLAALSKLPGLGVSLLAAALLAATAWQRRDWRLFVSGAAALAAPALAVAGWWYWRNHVLYGEWLAVDRLLTIGGLRETAQTWRGLWGELRGLRYSFWALFGWFSILLPGWIYRALDGVSLLALAGLVWELSETWRRLGRQILRAAEQRISLLLLIWAAMLVGLMLYWATFAISTQGRLLFPALGAFAILLVMGLDRALRPLPERVRRTLMGALPVGLVGCSFYALLVLLPASYRAPAPVTAIPAAAQTVDLVYDAHGDPIQLLAVEIPRWRLQPGQAAPITLYYRSDRPLHADYPVSVQLLDEQRRTIGNVTTHAGWGRNPTTLWRPGAIYPDPYLVSITSAISERSPLLAQVYVAFLDPQTYAPLTARTAVGEPASGIVGDVTIVPSVHLDPQALSLKTSDGVYGGTLRLLGYAFPTQLTAGASTLEVTLLWEALAPPAAEYTAFVHLLDASGRQVAGADLPPAEGRFPTDRWQPGDRSLSTFTLSLPSDLPSGRYDMRVGLYEAGGPGVPRLPVTAGSLPTRDDTIFLGSIERL